MMCQKYYKIPIVGDGNCLVKAISFCTYGSEDFYAEIREEVIPNITTRLGLLKDFTILKDSVVFKEYEIYYSFMVFFTDLHAVFKTEKSNGREPRSSKVAGVVLSKVCAGSELIWRAVQNAITSYFSPLVGKLLICERKTGGC
ncbi:hypothetical protein AVEN_25658-1 [Araneus ventricosus]|uniref:OTU domain-containing protein n=1 Tax=Araneus ventricosus TaxID=182803 RepID=A0A4Y2BN50_ARAVE|nr:hypothetical protein AVEN_25658-1 [Araneus ventricosus]